MWTKKLIKQMTLGTGFSILWASICTYFRENRGFEDYGKWAEKCEDALFSQLIRLKKINSIRHWN